VLLVVPPRGQRVRGFRLKWADGKAVDEASLSQAVGRYVAGMMVEGRLARGVRRSGAKKHSPAKHAALGVRLFRGLIPNGVWRELKSAGVVYVVPDGALHRLPFESLITPAPQQEGPSAKGRQYWLDTGPPLVYGPSATVLANRKAARNRQLERLAEGAAHKRQAVLLGDPIFRSETAPRALPPKRGAGMVERSGYVSRYGSLPPLPGTREEVRRIYRTLTGRGYRKAAKDETVAVLLGSEATRTRLFAAAPGSRYLHVATHGLVDTSGRAVYTGLALTQPEVVTPEDFGFLTLVDLFDHWWGRLGATELVVLSACDTQRGRIEAGEGVFGISWGFLYAGAPAVIASLWQVSDESTAEMMGELYGAISKQTAAGASAAKLRAFVAVRKALRRKHPEPYFWAPFIYIGDPR